MGIITATELTKDYGNQKGIFSVNLDVKKGEVFGFLGPNGAGKTTTIRTLMGFIRPDHGSCSILGMDCFHDVAKIQNRLGYLAGEIAFIEDMTGMQMLKFIAEMKGVSDTSRMLELMDFFELDPRGKVKKMSKGMKQKIGIIAAFLNDPEVILLDEPTSGLDPLMQKRFVELILREKQKGKTILMSSHIFEEIERTCDRTAIIRAGKIVAVEEMESLTDKRRNQYEVRLKSKESVATLQTELKQNGPKNIRLIETDGTQMVFEIGGKIEEFLAWISRYPIKQFDVKKQSLEEIFLQYYGEKGED